MLNEDICIRCWRPYEFDEDVGDTILRRVFVDREALYCPPQISMMNGYSKEEFTGIDGAPPPWCPRAFEHAVSEAMKNAE